MGSIPNTAEKLTSMKANDMSYEAHFMKAGKQIEVTTFTVSNGGKTLTIHAKGMSPAGEFENLQVFDKQ